MSAFVRTIATTGMPTMGMGPVEELHVGDQSSAPMYGAEVQTGVTYEGRSETDGMPTFADALAYDELSVREQIALGIDGVWTEEELEAARAWTDEDRKADAKLIEVGWGPDGDTNLAAAKAELVEEVLLAPEIIISLSPLALAVRGMSKGMQWYLTSQKRRKADAIVRGAVLDVEPRRFTISPKQRHAIRAIIAEAKINLTELFDIAQHSRYTIEITDEVEIDPVDCPDRNVTPRKRHRGWLIGAAATGIAVATLTGTQVGSFSEDKSKTLAISAGMVPDLKPVAATSADATAVDIAPTTSSIAETPATTAVPPTTAAIATTKAEPKAKKASDKKSPVTSKPAPIPLPAPAAKMFGFTRQPGETDAHLQARVNAGTHSNYSIDTINAAAGSTKPGETRWLNVCPNGVVQSNPGSKAGSKAGTCK